MRTLTYICLACTILINGACQHKNIKNTKNDLMTMQENREIIFSDGPSTIIYKTGKDYSKNVPVLMNQEKDRIISYPSPKDIYYEGKLAYPTMLENGYLLDNRGINVNVAFLSYTYEEYSQLEFVPSIAELQKKIIDLYPLTEFWECGTRNQYQNETLELNELIRKGFPGCIQKK